MERTVIIGCTAAIMATLIGCAWWLHYSIERNMDALIRDIEQMQR